MEYPILVQEVGGTVDCFSRYPSLLFLSNISHFLVLVLFSAVGEINYINLCEKNNRKICTIHWLS